MQFFFMLRQVSTYGQSGHVHSLGIYYIYPKYWDTLIGNDFIYLLKNRQICLFASLTLTLHIADDKYDSFHYRLHTFVPDMTNFMNHSKFLDKQFAVPFNKYRADVSKNCWMSGKQCRPWSDTSFCSIWSGSTLFI